MIGRGHGALEVVDFDEEPTELHFVSCHLLGLPNPSSPDRSISLESLHGLEGWGVANARFPSVAFVGEVTHVGGWA